MPVGELENRALHGRLQLLVFADVGYFAGHEGYGAGQGDLPLYASAHHLDVLAHRELVDQFLIDVLARLVDRLFQL